MKFAFEPLMPSIDRAEGHRLGVQAKESPRWYSLTLEEARSNVSPWDVCHELMHPGSSGFVEKSRPLYAEPDLEQQWPAIMDDALAGYMVSPYMASSTEDSPSYAPGETITPWYFSDAYSQFSTVLKNSATAFHGEGIRIFHLDTGWDGTHDQQPARVNLSLQHNFVDKDREDDARESTCRMMGASLNQNLGHGTATLAILASKTYGGAPYAEVVPLKVANGVILFRNGAIVRALDYVHEQCVKKNAPPTVVTMSMGGLASKAWARAVNALYDLGVFIVTAAGNNKRGFPTRHLVYPARFHRVVAACGVMEDMKPYGLNDSGKMSGNYGPETRMRTAMAAYTPETPWARLCSKAVVDRDGGGTSSATPQIAAAAALWLQKYRTKLEYAEPWMRVEAIRKALFDSADLPSTGSSEFLGHGVLRVADMLKQKPATRNELKDSMEVEDSVSFPLLSVLFGMAGESVAREMLEVEAVQLTQTSRKLSDLMDAFEARALERKNETDADGSGKKQTKGAKKRKASRKPDRKAMLAMEKQLETASEHAGLEMKRQILMALRQAPGASGHLKAYVDGLLGSCSQREDDCGFDDGMTPYAVAMEQHDIQNALVNATPEPLHRKLRVYAFDPLSQTNIDTRKIATTDLNIRWETGLRPGPVGEYLEVIDHDPSSGCSYAPVDLNDPHILARNGVPPSEANPKFHQQMVYAWAMKTIEIFEVALGRRAFWATKYLPRGEKNEKFHFVRRLRIYPHALREANAYYSPDKLALLFGYFNAPDVDMGYNLPGGTIFTCLSHDIVAHETAHALLDGLHRRYGEATHSDGLAFHEAFADIVALFQHFMIPEALTHQIRVTNGDLQQDNLLAKLAVQFGQGIGRYGGLRNAIGSHDEHGKFNIRVPETTDYEEATEPHDRGAVLVAAVFDAFLTVYDRRSRDLVRLATGGTGILPEGDISEDLANRLVMEASDTAEHILSICIRALDYCPPVNIMFGDYLRALVTADRDLVPEDPMGYRVAFISAFRRRGIYPKGVNSMSEDAICWQPPRVDMSRIVDVFNLMDLSWNLSTDRGKAYETSHDNAMMLHDALMKEEKVKWEEAEELGFKPLNQCKTKSQLEKCVSAEELENDAFQKMIEKTFKEKGYYKLKSILYPIKIENANNEEKLLNGRLHNVEVHSVRPARRIGRNKEHLTDIVVEITQRWVYKDSTFRGGCTLIYDPDAGRVRYCVRMRVGSEERIGKQMAFEDAHRESSLRSIYFNESKNNFHNSKMKEPYAMLHRGT